MEGKYLPIGSVVKLKDVDLELMIIGYLKKPEEKIYDYSACIYPLGIVTSVLDTVVFNHEQIEKIYHVGYKSEKFEGINRVLIKIMNAVEAEKNDK